MIGGYDLRRSYADGSRVPGRRSPILGDEAQPEETGLRMVPVRGQDHGPLATEFQQQTNRYSEEQLHSNRVQSYDAMGRAQVWSETPMRGVGAVGGGLVRDMGGISPN